MDYRIEVSPRQPNDGQAADLLAQMRQLGIALPQSVQFSTLYFIRGTLTTDALQRLAIELLVDPVVETYRWRLVGDPPPDEAPKLVIEVGFRPGVTDPEAWHLQRRASLLGIGPLEAVATGSRYVFTGDLTAQDLHRTAQEILCNDVIQTYTLGPLQPAFVPHAEPSDRIDIVPLRDANDAELMRISVERVLFMTIEEMRAVQREFVKIGRDPTDVELETLAQTWSEHCQHKTFKGTIVFKSEGGMARCLPKGADGPAAEEHEGTINGLLKTYLRAATEQLDRPWVRSAFVDNAGVIDFDDTFETSFKVETHNHPSALEPFGGANTGTGGVIRDIMGVSARPIACTDVLCFGPADMDPEQLPEGALHPRRITRGVIKGIEDYGNKMGLPTVSGAILYDPDYAANPLVFCGCLGLAKKGQHRTEPRPGDLCVALGGRTGRDGLHGATFSSAELTHETSETVGTVVQIGDPITEKAVLEAQMVARDEGLYTAVTDCGAGGFSSAVGEMGKDIGVEVELKDVPLKYPGLRPWEIWLSEAQERMVFAVPPENLERLGEICADRDVEMTVIGKFTGDRRLRVHYGGKLAADLDMSFLHEGWPRPTLKAAWSMPKLAEPEIQSKDDLTADLLALLADPDVASKENVIRRYDHEVLGGTLVKPLVGVANDGPSDGVVLRPLVAQGSRGIALGCGICPHYARLDPYAMAWAAIDEALRNVVAVGADPDQVAILDNFCWGNPALPDRLGSLVRACQGCYDAALHYRTPFISGKDSLNNEYVDPQGEKRTIPPTLLISSLGIVWDTSRATTMDLKQAGDLIYIVGETRAELGGSLYHRKHGALGGQVPAPVPGAIETMRALHGTISSGLVRACHDLSEGGLGVAAAEMALAGRLGLDLDIRPQPCSADVADSAVALFAESSGRFLVEVAPQNAVEFETAMTGHTVARIGEVTDASELLIRGLKGSTVVQCSLEEIAQAWQSEA